MEFYLYKFGIDGYKKIVISSSNVPFEQNFQSATGESVANFYVEADAYLKLRGWES